jgi:exodeoxyribonuclease VII large subunit
MPIKPPSNSADAPLSVAALTDQIKGLLERSLRQVWVSGEISNFRRQNSGHCYFSLKDTASQLPCVLFSRQAAQLDFELQNGQAVTLYGEINVFAPHGRYQLLVRFALKSGAGHLQIQFERLKRTLAAEGLFDSARKKALPVLIKKMALITSESGAALQDFLRILQRRNYAGHIYLLPASVQGQQALPEICQRLEQARTLPDIDLVVLTRGGGSAEDLQVFNQEKLARLLADHPLPTLSAIGHEIDTVLTDYVADQRAETPSAAAEMISSQWLRLKESLQQNILKFQQTFTQGFLTKREAFIRLSQQLDPRLAIRHCELKALKLDSAENKLLQHASAHKQTKLNRLKNLTQRLQRFHPENQIKLYQQAIEQQQNRILYAIKNRQHNERRRLNDVQKRLENNSIQASLNRGYAIVRTSKEQVLERAASAQQEDALLIQFADGHVDATVHK